MSIGKWVKVRTLNHYQFRHNYGLDHDEVVTPGGEPGEYFVVRITPFSVIIAIKPNGNILCVRQHRYTTDQVTIELPMGNADGGETLAAAKRELEEETGYSCESGYVGLGSFQEANGALDMWGHVFFARNVTPALNPEQDPLDQNAIELLEYSPQQIREMIADGRITDSSTICSFAIADYQGCFAELEKTT